MENSRWYKKSGGSAGSKGVDFQVDLLTVFLLNASRKLTNWRLSTENQEAGKFDDVVLEWNEGAILLQAKTRENRKITFDELMSTNSNKDDFSLPKYFYSYQEIKNKFPLKNLIICTNTNVDIQTLEIVEQRNFEFESMLDLHSDVTEENLKVFLEKLQFYSNYPSGKDLKRYIDQILACLSKSNLLWSGVTSENIHNKMREWFEQKRGEYFTYTHVRALLCEIRSDQYCKLLNSYNIQFKSNDLTFTNPKRIFQFICEEGYLLQVLKIHFTLQYYCKSDKIMYVNPDDPINIQNEAIEAFQLPNYKYLIIISPKVREESAVKDIEEKLKKILDNFGYKKVVLFADSKNELAKRIESNNSSHIIEECVRFSSLSRDTKESILKNKNIVFQGRNFSLEEIFITELCGDFDKDVNSRLLLRKLSRVIERTLLKYRVFQGSNVGSEEIFKTEPCRDFDKGVYSRILLRELSKETRRMMLHDTVFLGRNVNLEEIFIELGRDLDMVINSKQFGEVSRKIAERLLNMENIVFRGRNDSLEKIFTTEIWRDFDRKLNSEILEKLVRLENIKVGSQVLELDEQIACSYVPRKFETECNGKRKSLFEEKIYDVNEKIILIAGSAGMGKSTVLTKLAATIKINNPHLWVIRVQLSYHIKTLKEFQKQNLENTDYIMELLDSDETTRLTNPLERFIFRMDKKIVLLLDGVDEVSPDYTKVIMKMLTQCYEASNILKIFVATRPHMQQELELIPNVQSLILQPLDMPDQIYFLTKYWMKNLRSLFNPYNEMYETKCKLYAQSLINEGYCADIPLHLRMLAEIFQENNQQGESMDWQGCKEYLEQIEFSQPKLQKKINIAVLYDMFIEKKRDVFINKGNPSGNLLAYQALADQFEDSIAQHQNLALETILDDIITRKLFSCYKQSSENTRTKLLRLGIVQISNGNLQFIHRRFAEYFLARALLQELQLKNENVKFQSYFINVILIEDKFNVTRSFLDGFLQKEVDYLSSDTFHKYQLHHESEIIKNSNRSEFLHLLAQEGYVFILKLLFKCIDFKISNEEIKFYKLNTNKFKITNKPMHCNTLILLEFILKQGGVNIQDKNDVTPLHYAAKEGHLEMVKFLINVGAKVNCEDSMHWTPLLYATESHHFEVVEFLVQQGADMRREHNGYGTALQRAISKDHVNIVNYLLNENFKRDYLKTTDYNSLYASAYLGQLNILKTVPKLEENVNTRLWHDQTLVFGAALGGQLDTFRYLWQIGANINIKDKLGKTVLHAISENNAYIRIVEALVDLKIDINSKDRCGNTALHIAAECGIYSMVELLVTHGADVRSKNNIGRTAFFLAAMRNHRDVVKYLMNNQADVNVKDKNGYTVLHIASVQGSLGITKFLVNAGLDVNIKDKDGRTALNWAVLFQNRQIAEFLVENRADVNNSGRDGSTVLHSAVSFELWDMVKFSVECGVDVNIKDCHGSTALHIVASKFHSEALQAVQFLVDSGADINVLDNSCRTPLDIAVSARGQEGVVEYLVEHGGITNVENSGSSNKKKSVVY